MISMIGVKGHFIYQNPGLGCGSGYEINSDKVVPAPIKITSYENIDYVQVLKPVLDTIWQAAGIKGSPFYNADGDRTIWNSGYLLCLIWKGNGPHYYCRSMYKMTNRAVIPDRAITVSHVSVSKTNAGIMLYSCEGGTFQTQNNCNTCAGLQSLLLPF